MLHRSVGAWRGSPWFPPAAALVGMTLLSTVLLGGLGYGVADRLIHPARHVPAADPADYGLAYDRVAFASDDGVTLVGWWMPADEGIASGTVIFLHGYGASKAQALSVAPFLHRAGYHVLAFDFRAHGESGGSYTTVGIEEVRDVAAAVEYVRARDGVDAGRVALFGWSMGGATALNAARELPDVRAFIVDSSFARLENAISHTLPATTGLPTQPYGTLGVLFASWMVQRRVWENEPAREIAEFDRPLLIIQGMADTIARPQADGAALHDAAGPFSELWLVPEATHVNAAREDPAEYRSRVLTFLARHVAGVDEAAEDPMGS